MRSIRSYGMMSDETAEALLRSVRAELSAGDAVNFAFQGGEPTLAGIAFFRAFVARVSEWKDVRIGFALQTNGILIDEKWCAFLKEHNFLVGISLDLLPDAHDAERVDALGLGTYTRVTKSIELLRSFGVDFNVLCTLSSTVAKYPERVWEQLVKLNIVYVQFTPCLGALGGCESAYALTPALFSSFYTKLFELWYADYKRGRRRSVKLFDDVVNLMLLGYPTSCGMSGSCQLQLVVEADGSVYPCDFYCLDEFRLGNVAQSSLSELMNAPAAKAFLSRRHDAPHLCEQCPYRRFCGGNCKRMQGEICCSGEDDFCGYRSFLDNCGKELAGLAEWIRRTYFSNKH